MANMFWLTLVAVFLILQVTAVPRYNGYYGKRKTASTAFPPDNGEPHLYDDGMCFGPMALKTGLRQSPIDLQRSRMVKAPTCETVGEVTGFTEESDVIIRNTGESVNFQLLQASPSFELGHQDVVYTLQSMHYHWGGSEHELDGQRFDGEFHMVFYNTMYPNFAAAAKCTNGLSVVASFLKISEEDNPNLEEFIEAFQNIPFQNDTTEIKYAINVRQLMPKCVTQHYRYFGSLTTEPFSEVVKWTVIRDPVPISQRQMNEFKKLHTGGPGSPTIQENARNVKDIDGRLIFSTEHCECPHN